MIGKVPPDVLREQVFTRTGASDDDVRVGPRYGEDAAAIDLGDELLVVSSDPISLAVDRVGTLGVHVACNDVAASGADPRWLTVVLFLPEADESVLARLTSQLDEAASSIPVSIIGGHTEYATELSRPTLSLTALGTADRFISTGGAEPGDRILLTKGAGIEGTAILATDFRARFDAIPEELLAAAAGFFEEISVLAEATALRPMATAMHDPTEGGVYGGLAELAAASAVRAEVTTDAIPVRPATRRLCEAAGVDPCRIFGSGALLATVPPDRVEAAHDALSAAGVTGATVGTVTAGEPGVTLDGSELATPVRDDLYDLWT